MWCAPFSVRPPEEERKAKRDDDGPTMSRGEILRILLNAGKERVALAMQSLANKFKKKVADRTMPLEQKMKEARNATLTDEQARIFLNDSNPMVRLELVFNDTISGDILDFLKSDEDYTVSSAARQRSIKLELGV